MISTIWLLAGQCKPLSALPSLGSCPVLRVGRCDDVVRSLFCGQVKINLLFRHCMLLVKTGSWWGSKVWTETLSKLHINHHSFTKFCIIPWKHGNSVAKGKFRGSARNSVAHRKLWVLIIAMFSNCLSVCHVLVPRVSKIPKLGSLGLIWRFCQIMLN